MNQLQYPTPKFIILKLSNNKRLIKSLRNIKVALAYCKVWFLKLKLLWKMCGAVLSIALLAAFLYTASVDTEFRLFVFYPLFDAFAVFVIGRAFVRYFKAKKDGKEMKNKDEKDEESKA